MFPLGFTERSLLPTLILDFLLAFDCSLLSRLLEHCSMTYYVLNSSQSSVRPVQNNFGLRLGLEYVEELMI